MGTRLLRVLLLTVLCSATLRANEADTLARQVLDATNIRGGFVVHLGCGDGTLTRALRVNASYQVQGLDRDADRVAQAREALFRAGGYGDVCVDRLEGNTLPYIDNLVNLVVAEDLNGIAPGE